MDLLYSSGDSAQCHPAAWMGGESGENGYMLSIWLGPFAVHLKLSQHCLLISYTPIQNLKSFFFFKEPRQPWGEGLQVSGMASAKAWSEEWRGACVRDGGKDGKWGPGQSPAWAGTAGTESHVLLGTM